MMKVGILTHFNVSSHGALLQMYALQKELQERGHDVVILTFTFNRDFVDENTRKRFSASWKNAPYYLKEYMGSGGFRLLMYQKKKQDILARFRDRHFTCIPYTSSGGLDCVIVGADEVFALENGVNFMMFGHGITAKRIISYAPSFGQTGIERIDCFGCRELMKSGLEKFSAISVRDEGSKNVIKELTGKDVSIVCDPALLHDFGAFERISNQKYIVVYSYQSNFKNEDRIALIKKYAKEHRYELWSVGVYYDWCNKHINVDPIEMLNVFAKAQLVITDTFHGTISSYVARTPMAVFVRENNNVKLDYLLSVMGLENRKVSQLSQMVTILERPMDFASVDQKVEELRKQGASYLDKALRE